MFEGKDRERANVPNEIKSFSRAYERQGINHRYRRLGSGYSGLRFLALCQPYVLKIEMAITRGSDGDRVLRASVEDVFAGPRAGHHFDRRSGVETRESATQFWIWYRRNAGVSVYGASRRWIN